MIPGFIDRPYLKGPFLFNRCDDTECIEGRRLSNGSVKMSQGWRIDAMRAVNKPTSERGFLLLGKMLDAAHVSKVKALL